MGQRHESKILRARLLLIGQEGSIIRMCFLHDLDEVADTGDNHQFTDQPGRHFKIASLDDVVGENGFVLI